MIFLRIALLLVLFPFLLLARLVMRRRDMVYLPDDHEAMKAAVAEARTRLDEFWQALLVQDSSANRFAAKVRFPVEGGYEHIWVESIEPRGAGYQGKIANHPENLTGLTLGSIVDIDQATISDWGYFQDGRAHGHFTTRVLLPHVSRKMRHGILAAMGWTEDELDPIPPP